MKKLVLISLLFCSLFMKGQTSIIDTTYCSIDQFKNQIEVQKKKVKKEKWIFLTSFALFGIQMKVTADKQKVIK